MRNNSTDFRAMVNDYAVCLLWQGLDWEDANKHGDDSNADPLDDRYSIDDIDASAWRSIEQDCRHFLAANANDLADIDPGQAGHDFCLTRNGHGTGFWDRGLGEIGRRLTDAAHVYGDSGEYTSNGKVFVD